MFAWSFWKFAYLQEASNKLLQTIFKQNSNSLQTTCSLLLSFVSEINKLRTNCLKIHCRLNANQIKNSSVTMRVAPGVVCRLYFEY